MNIARTALLSCAAIALAAGIAAFTPHLSIAAEEKPVEAAAPVAAALDKTAVEKIIYDYIMANPQVILDAVDQHQRRTMQEKSRNAIKSNEDQLFKNDSSPFIGAADGDITVVEFFDYNCGYCKKVLPEVQKLIETDKKVKVVFKEYPILGPSSELAAKWALAAKNQNKYFEFHTKMMEHKGAIDDAVLEGVAKDVGLDVEKIKKDIEGTDIMIQIEKNRALAAQMGVNGTPAFVIGEEIVPGAIPADEMAKKIEEYRKTKK